MAVKCRPRGWAGAFGSPNSASLVLEARVVPFPPAAAVQAAATNDHRWMIDLEDARSLCLCVTRRRVRFDHNRSGGEYKEDRLGWARGENAVRSAIHQVRTLSSGGADPRSNSQTAASQPSLVQIYEKAP